MPRNSVTGEPSGTGGGADQAAAAVVITNGATIDTTVDVARVNPAGAVTGIIMPAGSYPGQRQVVVNESANSVTFAASGTSRVADGTSAVLSANRSMMFWWNAGTSLWYRT